MTNDYGDDDYKPLPGVCECKWRKNDTEGACKDHEQAWLSIEGNPCIACGHDKACHGSGTEPGEGK